MPGDCESWWKPQVVWREEGKAGVSLCQEIV